MKKNVNLIALIFQAVAAVSLFLPWMYAESYYGPSDSYYGGFTVYRTLGIGFFGGTADGPGFFGYLTLIVMIAAIVLLALQLSGKKLGVEKIANFVPAAAFVLFLLTSIIRFLSRTPNGGESINDPLCNGWWTYGPGWLFFIVAALQLATAVLAILMGLGKFKDTPKAAYPYGYPGYNPNATFPAGTNPAPNATFSPTPGFTGDVADELKKLKGLLDAGVITQEEFDAKKKQLLQL